MTCSALLRFSASISCGASVLWPAANDDMPTTCTLLDIARAAASGVWNSGTRQHIEADVAESRGDDFGAAISVHPAQAWRP